MNGQIDITERSIETSVGTTYCRLVAGPPSTRPPLIVVHGGPGFTWNYLGELDQLAAAGQPVIYYDQLGNGLSGSPPGGAEAISLAVLCQQLRDVVSALIGDGRYFLLGHSAGSVVALEHALENPPGLAGLVIANGGAAARDVADSIWRCRRNLPAAMQIALDRGDADGNTTSDAYNAAIGEFFQRHVCRTATMPAGLQHALA
ncbi:MAG TPA: alpha/beta fold hydrolase, partial [Devosia sp.]|nr:alpha/beta fold hydrolase [Devosia sp.]